MRIVLEPERNFSTFLAARLVFLTALLGVAALFHATKSLVTYLILFAANATLSLGCWEWARRTGVNVLLTGSCITAAVILDTIVLRYTGGGDSEFIFLYFFVIGSAGLLIGLRGALWAATLSIGGALWLFGIGQPGFLNDSGLKSFVYSLNFVLTAVIASYVYERIKESERCHQKALGELEQAKLDTQAILDSLSTGVVVMNSSGDILYSNPAGREILGFGGENAGKSMRDIMTESSDFGAAVARLAKSSGRENREEVTLIVDGIPRPVGLSVSELRDAMKRPRGVIVLFNDLTRIKDRERAEREQERLAAIGLLSRDLAHEIRNPLATVRGCVEMLQTVRAGEDEAAPFLTLALRESDRLNDLLQGFLKFANIGPPRKVKCDLMELIKERCADRPVEFAYIDQNDTLQYEVDTDQISLVVDSILLSLSEWGEGSTIEVIPSNDDRRVLRVGIRGVTIPQDECAEAFRPFSGVNKRHGSLLLPTAWRAVQAHGGRLTLQSNPVDGTWFELTL